jgi:deazaflavin-dependent oxidoreductase (nitroreductase family)
VANLFFAFHVWIYRLTDGRLGGKVMGLNFLLIATIGSRSGKKRTIPVMYLQDDGNYVITASNAGRDQHAEWFKKMHRLR